MTKRIRARRDEDKLQRREDIVDAAERAIKRHGLANFTFGHVAQRTRLSRSLMYVYFPRREDLVFAVCERALRELQRRLEAARAEERLGLDQIVAMGWAYKAFSEEEPLYFNVVSETESKVVDPRSKSQAEALASERGQKVLGLVAETVQAGMKDGSVHSQSGDPLLTALSIWAFTHGLIQISNRKRCMLEQDFKLSPELLIEHGFTVMRSALAAGNFRAGQKSRPRAKRIR